MDFVQDHELKILDKSGEEVDADTLDDQVVLLYFSAGDDPKARRFARIYTRFTQVLEERGANMQTVFVSHDATLDLALRHFDADHGDWLRLDYEQCQGVSQHFGVRDVPSVVIVNGEGAAVDVHARVRIAAAMVFDRCGMASYFVPGLFEQWQDACGCIEALLPEDFHERQGGRRPSKVVQQVAQNPVSIAILVLKILTLMAQISIIDSAQETIGGSQECVYVYIADKMYLLMYVVTIPLYLMKACRVAFETISPFLMAENVISLLLLLYAGFSLYVARSAVCAPLIFSVLACCFAMELAIALIIDPCLQSKQDKAILSRAMAGTRTSISSAWGADPGYSPVGDGSA